MVELGQLEKRHQNFAAKNVQIVAASLDDLDHTAQTQAKFPHLILVSDGGRKLADAANVIGPHQSADGKDSASPTTFIIDANGMVRSIYRARRFIERLSADELLAKLEK